MLRRVYLYGALSDKFGSEPVELDSSTVYDVLLALRSIFPDWRIHIRENPEMVFVLSGDNKDSPRGIEKDLEDAWFDLDATEIHILPVQEGSIGAIPMFASWALEHAIATMVINAVISTILSTVLGAVIQSLSPQPQTGAGEKNQVAQNQSFLYNGAVNVQEQGGAVPIIYGVFMAGSTVISSEVATEQLLVDPTQSAPPANLTSPLVIQAKTAPLQTNQWAGFAQQSTPSLDKWKIL